MGYTTDFNGSFTVTPALKPEHAKYLKEFNGTRRMKRDAAKAGKLSDPIRAKAKLPVGDEGGYFVGNGDGNPGKAKDEGSFSSCCGQQHDGSILDYNQPPAGQPGLWCQWVPSDDGARIEWDGCEKFYDYAEWLRYLVEHFLAPWGYTLSGDVEWQGEGSGDSGVIRVKGNKVHTAGHSRRRGAFKLA